MNLILKASVIIFTLLSPIANSAESFDCPIEIETNQSTKLNYEGWTISNSQLRHDLYSVEIVKGAPNLNQGGEIPNEEVDEPKRIVRSVWRIPPDGEFWLRCGYRGSNILLSKKLPATTKICVERFDESTLTVISMKCN